MRGIYLRNLSEVSRARNFTINVTPVFTHDAGKDGGSNLPSPPPKEIALFKPLTHIFAAAEHKAQFSRSLLLSCAEPWVHHPTHLSVCNGTVSFAIMLDVQGLPEDRVYFTEVENFYES